MKRTVKILLITAAVLIVAGALLIGGALASAHWDLTALSGASYETNTVVIADAFRDISIVTDTDDIVFRPSDDGKCTVVFVEDGTERHSAAVQNGTLTIDVTADRKWSDGILSFSSRASSVTIFLPRGEYASLSIRESTGDISIPADFGFENVRIALSTGDVDCRASASGEIRIEGDTGRIRMEGAKADSLALSVTTGRVELRSVACGGTLELNVSTGKTFLTDVSCGRFVTGGSTGDLRMENVTAEGLVSVKRSTGDVELTSCDAGELQITTETGDVTGTLRSEKVFIVRSDTGKIDVPETVSGGKCAITTDTGDIRIQIQ